jgi:hypothetical protein
LKQPALRREICGHKARLTPPFFIEVSVPVPSQENVKIHVNITCKYLFSAFFANYIACTENIN